MKLKVTCIGLALAGLVCIAHAQKRDESEVVNVGKGDPDMAAAIQQARATLPDFLALAAKPPAGTEEYKLKVQVVDGRQTEHFWVTLRPHSTRKQLGRFRRPASPERVEGRAFS